PVTSAIPVDGIGRGDFARRARANNQIRTGQALPGIAKTYEIKSKFPMCMTHHILMQIDGSGSMGTEVSTDKQSRQRIATKLAVLMYDAICDVNRKREMLDLNGGAPVLTGTIIKWGDPTPTVNVSSSMEPAMIKKPNERAALINGLIF